MGYFNLNPGLIRERARVPGAALLTVSIAVALTRVRPSIGWPVLLGTAVVAFGVGRFFGQDLRAEHAVARSWVRGITWASEDHHTANRKLGPNTGALTRFCLWTAGLATLYIFAYAVYLR